MLNTVFLSILDMTRTGSLVILAVLLARLLLRRVPKTVSYALWAVVLLRLLLPVGLLQSPVSILPELTPAADNGILSEPIVTESREDPVQNEEDQTAQTPQTTPGTNIQAPAVTPGTDTQTSNPSQPAQTPAPAESQFSIQRLIPLLAYLWAAGFAAMAAYSLVSILLLKRRLREAVRLETGVYLADGIASPFVLGLLRPRIYLPDGLDSRETAYILAHERHHIRRMDPVWKALGFLALSLHWFNPLVWLAFCLACRDMEMSCDEAVLKRFGEDIRGDYAASLLKIATGKPLIAGVPLAFGEGDPKGRIQNLARWKKPILWVSIVAVVLCAVLAVCLLTDPADQPQTAGGSSYYFGTLKAIGQDKIVLACEDGRELTFLPEEGCEIPEQLSSGDTAMVRASWQEEAKAYTASRVALAENLNAASLDEAVHAAIEGQMDSVKENQYACFSYVGISQENSGIASPISLGTSRTETVTAYGILLSRIYASRNGKLVQLSGSHTHVALTFRVTDGGEYVLSEYWQPRESSYTQDVEEKFGSVPKLEDYLAQQEAECLAQAEEHFAPPEPPATHPGLDVDYGTGAPSTKYPFIFDPEDKYLLYDLGFYSHFMDVETLNPGGLYVVERRENKLLTLIESGAQMISTTPDTVFCVVDGSKLIRCDYEGKNMQTVYEASYGKIISAARLKERMCLVETDHVVCVNLITYQVEAVYDCENAASAFLFKSEQILWRTDDYRYFLIDKATLNQQELSEEEASDLSSRWDAYPPEDFIPPTEPPVPDDLVIPEGIPGVITYAQPLESLSRDYTPQQAANDGCVVMIGGDVWANEDIWTAYTVATSRSEKVKVRFAEYDDAGQLKRLYELVYSGGHVYRLLEEGQVTQTFYKYVGIEANIDYDGGYYNMYKVYALTNEGMWELINTVADGVPYDDSTWDDSAIMVYCDLIMVHEHPQIPEKLQHASLIQDGKTVAQIWNGDKLEQLRQMVSNAEEYRGEPKTQVMGPVLVMTGTDGAVVTAEVMLNSAMLKIDGAFYNYDPGWAENYDVPDLLEIFGDLEDILEKLGLSWLP